MKGLLVVVSGPSGAGKTKVLGELLEAVPTCQFSISVTTRAPRKGEIRDKTYDFVSEETFKEMRDRGELLEYAEVHSHYYGTPRKALIDNLERGKDVILDIDVQGANQVRTAGLDAVFIFLAPPSSTVLEERLRARGTESESQLLQRLETARKEMEKRWEYHYLIVNEEVDDAVGKLKSILTAEKCRVSRIRSEVPSIPQTVAPQGGF